METLLNSISADSTLSIHGKLYQVTGKAIYTTKSEPDSLYTKIFLEGHKVLVFIPDENLIYFGTDKGNIGDDFISKDTFIYQNETYKKTAEDQQIVTKIEFGDPRSVEGEVKFWDFENTEDETKLISLAVCKQSGERADVVADVINLSDIVIN